MKSQNIIWVQMLWIKAKSNDTGKKKIHITWTVPYQFINSFTLLFE